MRKGRIALVGHEPNIGELAARLIGARAPLEFKKGGICRIDFDVFPPKGTGQLRWFVPPRMLRSCAERRRPLSDQLRSHPPAGILRRDRVVPVLSPRAVPNRADRA